MTRVTLQGNGDGEVACGNCGLLVNCAMLYADGAAQQSFEKTANQGPRLTPKDLGAVLFASFNCSKALRQVL
jgi:hypothetical protein